MADTKTGSGEIMHVSNLCIGHSMASLDIAKMALRDSVANGNLLNKDSVRATGIGQEKYKKGLSLKQQFGWR